MAKGFNTRIINISTIEGIEKAERLQARGWRQIVMYGLDKIKMEKCKISVN